MRKKPNPQKYPKTLHLILNNHLWTTDHIARYYAHRGSPTKRASEELTEWESWGYMEGKRRAIGESKVWRLTTKGRKALECGLKAVPFNSGKLDHFLDLTTTFQDLNEMGTLKKWAVELREPFNHGGRDRVYAPDAFFILQTDTGTKAYLLEVQRSPLTTLRWAEKWAVASSFFESEAFPRASFQVIQGKIIKPRLLTISRQQPETVQGGSRLSILITPDIKKVPL